MISLAYKLATLTADSTVNYHVLIELLSRFPQFGMFGNDVCSSRYCKFWRANRITAGCKLATLAALSCPPIRNSCVLIELPLHKFPKGELRSLWVRWVINQRLFPRPISQRGHRTGGKNWRLSSAHNMHPLPVVIPPLGPTNHNHHYIADYSRGAPESSCKPLPYEDASLWT